MWMLFQLQRYDLNVSYMPGKELQIADTLSKATTHGQDQCDHFDEKVVYALESTEALRSETLEQLTFETQTDPILQALQDTHRQGWPQHRKQVDKRLTQYWPIRHTVSVRDRIIFAEDRIILPTKMRTNMLQRLHGAYQGNAMHQSSGQSALVLARHD